MTLRLRLVLALTILAAVGLAVFGVVTYSLYAQSQYERLDDQVRGTAQVVIPQLRGDTPAGADGAVTAPPDTYAVLYGPGGRLVDERSTVDDGRSPDLPTDLEATSEGTFSTVGSSGGGGDWRVYAQRTRGGETVVVASPTDDVADALHQLVVIELAAAGALLVVLAAGAWLILRHGLRPLERMAVSAREIAAGDVHQRVGPADDRTEVGQLGLAINTMLDDIEDAFRERDATERRLRTFLSDASHELRTPLTSIRGFAELVRLDDGRGQVDAALALRRIESEATRMGTLVDELLLLARLDETRPPSRAPVDLVVLAADACSDFAAARPDHPVTLDAPAPAPVVGDEGHLRQAIANLLANAGSHTPAGTAVDVAVGTDGTDAWIVVRDHGPGLPPESLDHVFDRFWQADAARAGSGAGLGLAIVAGIAAEHGGRAAAEEAPGGGARFTLTVPAGPSPTLPAGDT